MTRTLFLTLSISIGLAACFTVNRSINTLAELSATVEKSAPAILTKLCERDTQACFNRIECIENKRTHGALLGCCPELQLCNARAAKLQDALVKANKAIAHAVAVQNADELVSVEEELRKVWDELQ